MVVDDEGTTAEVFDDEEGTTMKVFDNDKLGGSHDIFDGGHKLG